MSFFSWWQRGLQAAQNFRAAVKRRATGAHERKGLQGWRLSGVSKEAHDLGRTSAGPKQPSQAHGWTGARGVAARWSPVHTHAWHCPCALVSSNRVLSCPPRGAAHARATGRTGTARARAPEQRPAAGKGHQLRASRRVHDQRARPSGAPVLRARRSDACSPPCTQLARLADSDCSGRAAQPLLPQRVRRPSRRPAMVNQPQPHRLGRLTERRPRRGCPCGAEYAVCQIAARVSFTAFAAPQLAPVFACAGT